jgi:hypothetical protein
VREIERVWKFKTIYISTIYINTERDIKSFWKFKTIYISTIYINTEVREIERVLEVQNNLHVPLKIKRAGCQKSRIKIGSKQSTNPQSTQNSNWIMKFKTIYKFLEVQNKTNPQSTTEAEKREDIKTSYDFLVN